MDKAYRLGDKLFDSISMNIFKLNDITYFINTNLGYCQSVTERRKFNSTAAIVIPEAKKCIDKKVEDYYWWQTSTVVPVTEAATNATTAAVREISNI